MIDRVDPFIGTEPADLPPPSGLAATWWWPKPQIGNTHPGATHPLGMVSACAYSGAYPTGYGRHDLTTEGRPPELHTGLMASGITHFQQSGTGAIRKYYNYYRVTPMLGPLDDLGTRWDIVEEEATPGYYACLLSSGIRCEVTVGPRSAVHRFTFPAHRDARIVVDASMGGLDIPYGATIPLRAMLHLGGTCEARGEVVMEGAPLAAHLECDPPTWRQVLWYDRRVLAGGTTLEFDAIRPTTLRPFGLFFAGPTTAGQTVELRIGFSLRGGDQAQRNLRADCPDGSGFAERHERTRATWAEHLDLVRVEGPAERETIHATALYHSLIKPCLAPGESPFWPDKGPFAFDLCTMWDIYRTQLPLLKTILPERAVELANALLTICEQEGNLPIGYRMARGEDRFSRQASALAHTLLSDLCQLNVPGIDWDWALVHMQNDLRRTYGEEFWRHGITHPISHTLDLAFGHWCSATVAAHLGDIPLTQDCDNLAARWANAFDPATGLLRDSTFYEGGRWNYSFRLLHDMAARIRVAGGDEAFVGLLDRFFGFGAAPVTQPGIGPSVQELEAGFNLHRFEGLNNEPDMDAPWAYMFAGRPDRTAEVVHAAVHQMFGTGRGGLPGNDDSGGLSSWYVWASMGLFPVAGQDLVLLNAPAFEHASLRVGEETFTVETAGFRTPEPDGPPQYVQRVSLDGRPISRPWLSGADLARGGTLVVELGDEPGGWGSDVRPPSRPNHGLELAAVRPDRR